MKTRIKRGFQKTKIVASLKENNIIHCTIKIKLFNCEIRCEHVNDNIMFVYKYKIIYRGCIHCKIEEKRVYWYKDKINKI